MQVEITTNFAYSLLPSLSSSFAKPFELGDELSAIPTLEELGCKDIEVKLAGWMVFRQSFFW